jgi:SAGA-associated factor 11
MDEDFPIDGDNIDMLDDCWIYSTDPTTLEEIKEKEDMRNRDNKPDTDNEYETNGNSSPAENELDQLKNLMYHITREQRDPAFANAILSVVDDLLNDLILEVCFEIHKKLKTGLVCINCEFAVDLSLNNGSEFFMQNSNYEPENVTVTCTNTGCKRTFAATRFISHLEKCTGRNSRSRPKRGKSSEQQHNHYESGHEGNNSKEMDDLHENLHDMDYRPDDIMANDDDQFLEVKKNKYQKSDYQQKIDTLIKRPAGELELELKQHCGVISMRTLKMCSKSLRCPIHKKFEKEKIRKQLLEPRGTYFPPDF